MGMDPIEKEEAYEITVSIEGPVKKKGFRDLQKALDAFIDACANVETGYFDTSVTPPVKLKALVRQSRGGVRKNPT